MIGQRVLAGLLVAGWLADALASKDADVEAGIDAYENGRLQEALDAFTAAQERLGERPEIHFDRGLAWLGRGEDEEAREAFLHASEAEDASMRSSAHYQLGNMAFDEEDWDGAITHYVESLKAWPDHANAKWNLELALRRKREEEEEEQDQEQTGDDASGSGGEDGSGEPGSGGGSGQPGSGETGQEGTGGSEEGDPGETGEDAQETGQQPPEPANEQEEEAAAQPMDRLDIQKALEQLDAEDDFRLGKPLGRVPVPDKDW